MPNVTRESAEKVVDIIPLAMRAVAAQVRRSGHTLAPSHMRILAMLSLRPWSLGELAEHEMVSPATISRTITTMEEKGWVVRDRSEVDRRIVTASLTASGQEVLHDMREHAVEKVERLLTESSAQDCETLKSGLDVLERAFLTALGDLPAGDRAGSAGK